MKRIIMNSASGLKNGRFPGMNEYTAANRTNYHVGAAMKRNAQSAVMWAIRQQKPGKIMMPVVVHFRFYEPNRKRDLDNISGFAHKVILDALVATRTIPGDGWKHVRGYSDAFYCDPDNPRIEVYLEEVPDSG